MHGTPWPLLHNGKFGAVATASIRPQMSPMLDLWTLLSGVSFHAHPVPIFRKTVSLNVRQVVQKMSHEIVIRFPWLVY